MDNNNNNSKNKLSPIPFSSMMAAPIKACIDAQAMAARTTWDFVHEVGLDNKPVTDDKKDPLISLVPVPPLKIDNISIDFKMEISESFKDETTEFYDKQKI